MVKAGNCLVKNIMLSEKRNLKKQKTCDPGGSRTHNLLLRRQLLYPVELRDHFNAECRMQNAECRMQNAELRIKN
jgi:hypothetical protein